MNSFPKLLDPGRIGALPLKNRIIMTPMVTRLVTKGGGITDALVAFYQERARGGAALVVVEGTYVTPYPGRICVSDDRFIPGLRRLSDALHSVGAKTAVEVNISRGRADEVEAVSPSDVPHPKTGVKPRPLSIEEIEWLIEANAEGVRRVREAGFDAMMIHASHGYLISDFLSPLSNKREDQYGGSLENRARFLLELVQRTRERVGPDYPIFCRMMGSDRVGHFSFQDAAEVCRMLQKAGISLVDVTSGAAEAYEWAVPPERIPRACNVDAAEVIKRAVSIPVMVTGRITDPYLAEQILEEGKADFIGMARGLVADPEFPQKAMTDRAKEIRQCIGCERCAGFILDSETPIRCTVNPFAGRETEIEIRPAEQAKRILVVGGGPGGMEAARIAALRGHDVTLWERADRLGGQLHLACLPPDKGEIQSFTEYLSGQMSKLGVKVELGKEATPESVLDFKPEVAVVATGATPKLPELPGADLSKVATASDVLGGRATVGQRVAVLSIDSLGCEVAEFLADRGKEVTVVEPSEMVASDTFFMSHTVLLHNLEHKGVGMLTNTRPVAITEEGVTVVDGEGKQRTLLADTVVAALGFTPRKELFQALEERTRVYQIGDCTEPRKILEAVHDGAEIAMNL